MGDMEIDSLVGCPKCREQTHVTFENGGPSRIAVRCFACGEWFEALMATPQGGRVRAGYLQPLESVGPEYWEEHLGESNG